MKSVQIGMLLVVALAAGGASALPFFENFEGTAPLDGWTSSLAAASGGIATLTDGDAFLFQAVQLDPLTWSGDHYTFSFDFQSSFGPTPENTFGDLFAASLYFTNNPDGIAGIATADGLAGKVNMALLDQDNTGIRSSDFYITYENGTITDSSLGAGWYHYTLDFAPSSSYLYAIPVFELFNLNGSAGDSFVQLDNVSLVPEPVTMVMLGCLGAGMLAARKMRQRKA